MHILPQIGIISMTHVFGLLGGYLKNIWVPLSGQIAQQRKVETIANNIANANTIGFKKDRLSFKEHLSALSKDPGIIDIPREDWSPKDFYHSQGNENAYVKVDGSYTVHEQGTLTPTGNPLDLALKGKGFLEVQTPMGIRLTRKGTLSINKDGELVNDRGYFVLNNNYEEKDINKRHISLSNPKTITIGSNGKIFTDAGLLDQISIVEAKDPNALRKEGQSLFISNSKNNIINQNVKTGIHQGFLEGSNVNAVQEMSELIKAHRHFDNIQKAIQTYDTISGKAVNEISKF